MSQMGLCQACETRPAAHRCDHCGSVVCETHYDDTRGLCTACVSKIDPTGSGPP